MLVPATKSSRDPALGWHDTLARIAGNGSRELSLAQTKVEEAGHWLRSLDPVPGGRP